mgnify:CR=1 FL=1
MNQVLETIRQRRSVRHFRPDPPPAETIRLLLEAATWAPSAGNLQPWEFWLVSDQALRQKLAAAASQRFLGEAPLVIVVCARPGRSAAHYRERGENLYCLQDTAAAIQNLMLAAASLGLATCWVGAFQEKQVLEVLKLPHGRRPVALIPVGYPSILPKAPPRRPLEEVAHWR